MNSRGLKDQVILVTGAGKGIGEALVKDLISRHAEFPGLKLCLTARTESDLKRLEAIAKTNHVGCKIIARDLTLNPAGLVEACVKEFGKLDVLLHSAGVGVFGDFLEVTEEQIDFVIDTNVKATFKLLQSAFSQMKIQPPQNQIRGQIQVITSVAAERPFPHSSIYCMSKYAQRGIIDVMRSYGYEHQVRICEVRPGAVYTPMWGQAATPEMQTKMMRPEQIASAMLDSLLLPPLSTVEVLTIRPMGGDL